MLSMTHFIESVDCRIISTLTALTVNVQELLEESDYAAVEEGGALHKPMQMVKYYGSGFWQIFQVAFIYIAIFSVTSIGVGFMVHRKNAMKASEEKAGAGHVVIGLIAGFAASLIVAFFQFISQNLFSFE